MSCEADISVAELQVDEIPQLARLHALSQRSAYARIVPADALARVHAADRRRQWTQRLTSSPGDHHVLVARHGAAMVGFIVLSRRPDGVGVVISLHVHPRSRRRGVGQRLHDQGLEALASVWGCGSATLTVLRANRPARTFYERNGWVATHEPARHQIGGVPVDVVTYHKDLG